MTTPTRRTFLGTLAGLFGLAGMSRPSQAAARPSAPVVVCRLPLYARFLQCQCGTKRRASSRFFALNKDLLACWDRFELCGWCPACGEQDARHTLVDHSWELAGDHGPSDWSCYRYPEKTISALWDPCVKEWKFVWTMPDELVERVKAGDPATLATVPMAVLDTVRRKLRCILLDPRVHTVDGKPMEDYLR